MKTQFFRLSYFIWLIVPAALFTAWLSIGLPHMLWSYRSVGGGTYIPFDERHFTSCTFVGPYGVHTASARDGRCGFIRFFKEGN